MKKVIAWLLVLALTAAVSIGATLAYLTDTDEDVNVMTIGKVKIDQLEYERIDDESKDEDATVQEFHDNKPLYPGVYETGFDFGTEDNYVNWDQIGKDGYTSGIWNPDEINNEVDKMVFVKNKGDYDAYVRTVFAFEAGNYTTLEEFQKMVHLNLNEDDFTWQWVQAPVTIGESTYFVATATYNKVLEPGALTEISLSQIALDKTATNEDVEAFGETYQVLVKSQAIQADGFEDPAFALDEGFGVVDASNVPWDSDSATQGDELRKALHYDPEGNQITTSVTSIIFGKKADYPEIVNNNKGYLVDVDQDVPAHIYYVNGLTKAADGYTVYVLSNDTVYAPKDSTGLFRGMNNVTMIDGRNLDMSRVENVTYLFRDCSKLQKVDTTGWDTSNITNMQGVFYKCPALVEITGINDWDVSSVTSLYAAFYNLHAMTELDLSGWDTSSVTKMDYVIANNDNLETINLTGWDWSNVTTSIWAFRKNPKLQNIIGSADWYMPNNTDMLGMLSYNDSLVSIDVSNWDTGSCTRYHDMFVADTALETVVGIGNWDTGSATNMISLFNGCTSLKDVGDLSGWDMSNVLDIGYMFYNCRSLTEIEGITNWNTNSLQLMGFMFADCLNLTSIDLSGWDVSNVTTMNSLFSSRSQNAGNMKLQEVNLSGWDTRNVTHIGWMFYGCGNLTNVDLSGWNVENLENMSHMFADCYSLETINFTGWNTKSLKNLDGTFNNCESMISIDMSMFNTSNVEVFAQTFEACYSLEKVIGIETWDTAKGNDFSEMFSGCRSLKELDLSGFDTRNANISTETYVDVENWVYLRFLSGCTKLEKITFGPYFDFDGVGNCPEGYKFKMPSASGVEGWDGHWYDAEGNAYLPSEIPEMTARTYYAVNPVNP